MVRAWASDPINGRSLTPSLTPSSFRRSDVVGARGGVGWAGAGGGGGGGAVEGPVE